MYYFFFNYLWFFFFFVNKIKNSKLRFNHAFSPWKRLSKWALTCWVILPKESPRRFLITPLPFPKPTHVKVCHQVKFIPLSSHPHLNPSLFISFSSHCLCTLKFSHLLHIFSLSKRHCIILSFNIVGANWSHRYDLHWKWLGLWPNTQSEDKRVFEDDQQRKRWKLYPKKR